jgi:hypothetical protein
MPDFDHDPAERSLRRLRALASAGRAHARGLPPEHVRALGARRHRRRVAASVAAVSVVVAGVAGGVLTATGQLVRTTPQPAAAPDLPRSVLLRAAETVYFEQNDFRVAETVRGEGSIPVSICQRGSLASLGAVDVWRRDFDFRAGGGPVLRTAAMQFRDAAAATAASRTLGRWSADCGEAVRSHGYRAFDGDGRWYDVPVQDGVARFRSGMVYGPVEDDPFGELRYFDDQGLVVAGDRVMLVTLVVPGQDWNWAYSRRDARQIGLAMNPMFGTLREAAQNLAG